VCPVEFSGESGNTWVSWTYGTFRVAVCMVLWNSLELGVYGIFGSLDLRILSVPPENKNGGLCVFASRLVLRIFLELYGTLVSVSAQLVMPLHDSDILTNIPFTSCNKQPITNGLTPVRPCNGSTLFLTARSDCWGCAFPHCAATVRPQSRRCSSLSVLLHRCGEGPLDDHCVPHSCKECGG
jgi:hypothetical protein